MLVLTIGQEVEYIQIGENIRIYHMPLPGRYLPKIKIGIDAPENVKILRSNAKNKDKEKDDE